MTDPNFRNQYMLEVQDGPDAREQFTLPVARAARAAYERPGLLGHLVQGARDVVPTAPWDPDKPKPDLAAPPRETPFEYAVKPLTNLGSAVRGAAALAGSVFGSNIQAPQQLNFGGPMTEQQAAEINEYDRQLGKLGTDTALNMIGVGKLPGAAPPGSFGAGGGGAPTLRGAAGERAWREGTAEERLRTTNHPWGGTTPIRDMPKAIIQGAPVSSVKKVNVEKDLKNAELIFLPGDATGAGGKLAGVEGLGQFENPVARMGGNQYGQLMAQMHLPGAPEDLKRFWASMHQPMASILNVAKGVEQRGNVPWGVYMTGGKEYMDQATQMVNTAIEAARAKGVSKDMNDHLVKVMRSDWNQKADKELLFPEGGLNDPAAVQWWLANQPMPQRAKLVKAMGTAQAQKLGFPDIGVLRVANADPRLLTAQPGSAGLVLGRIDTSKGLITPSYHPDYSTAIAADQVRTFGRQLPPEVIAATMHQQRANQIRPLKEGQPSAYFNAPHLYYGARGTAQKTEPVTNQWKDTVQNWLANNPEQKIGGVVLGAGANDARSVALAAGLNAVRDPQLGSTVRNAPIRAYHSSPHDFDRFDLSKIGTGEGAQAYGHGLYFAENPKVSGQGGQYWNQFKNHFAYNPAETEAINVLQNHNFDRDKAIAELTDLKRYQPDYVKGATNSFDRARREEINAKNNAALELLKSGKPIGPRTYEVNINARPEQLLNYDAPLSEQPAAVQDLLGRSHRYDIAKVGDNRWEVRHPGGWVPNAAQNFYRSEEAALKAAEGLNVGRTVPELLPRSAEQARPFVEAGIPGIRYLDEGSRPAQQAPKHYSPQDVADYEAMNNITRNYVIFDPGIIEIAKKYGIPGMLGAGALGSTVAPDRYGRGS